MEFIATEITPDTVTYKCSECFTRYRKDGFPARNAKNIYHRHGNDTKQPFNRVLFRTHHSNRNSNIKNVKIIVNNDTCRRGFTN